MLTKEMIKAIKAFEKEFKNKGVEIRTVYLLESGWFQLFNIEFNVIALNKYYSVDVRVESDSVVVDSDIKEC